MSWTLNPRALEEVEELVSQGRARGYRHFNLKIAPDAKFDLKVCRVIKSLVPEAFLWVDANAGYDEATALEVAPKLAAMSMKSAMETLPS